MKTYIVTESNIEKIALMLTDTIGKNSLLARHAFDQKASKMFVKWFRKEPVKYLPAKIEIDSRYNEDQKYIRVTLSETDACIIYIGNKVLFYKSKIRFIQSWAARTETILREFKMIKISSHETAKILERDRIDAELALEALEAMEDFS